MKTFDEAYRSVSKETLLGRRRCEVLRDILAEAAAVPGDVAELGVYRGGTLKLLASLAPDRTVHGFDTFNGLPEVDPEKDNHHKKGDFSKTSLARVAALTRGLPNVRLHEGVFPATARAVAGRRFCFVHVDADIYPSVLAACEFFYPRMPGGAMVFDDYGSWTCAGAKAAVDEFFSGRPERVTRGAASQAVVRLGRP